VATDMLGQSLQAEPGEGGGFQPGFGPGAGGGGGAEELPAPETHEGSRLLASGRASRKRLHKCPFHQVHDRQLVVLAQSAQHSSAVAAVA